MIKLIQAGNYVGKRPLGDPRARWKDQMKSITKRIDPEIQWRILALGINSSKAVDRRSCFTCSLIFQKSVNTILLTECLKLKLGRK